MISHDIRTQNGSIRVLTDPEAAIVLPRRFAAYQRGMRRTYALAKMVDRTKLTGQQAKTHEHNLAYMAAIMQGAIAGEAKASRPPHARSTPGVPAG